MYTLYDTKLQRYVTWYGFWDAMFPHFKETMEPTQDYKDTFPVWGTEDLARLFVAKYIAEPSRYEFASVEFRRL